MLATGEAPAGERTAETTREDYRRLVKLVGLKPVSVASVENGSLPGPTGPLPFRIYAPKPSTNGRQPACVYFHGGTGVFGSIETHDSLCRVIANESGYRVISIDYRLAPEHKFPAAVYDCYAATQWVTDHAERLEIDDTRIAVAGDSAGATLAAAVCQLAAERRQPKIALQVLLCPVLDVSRKTHSRRAFASGYFLDATVIDWALTQLCLPGTDLKDPRLSPIYGRLGAHLPPAQIHTAEFDPFCSEGQIYARLLRRAGVSVEYTCHKGMLHDFYGMAGAVPSAYRHVLEVAAALKRGLAEVPDPRQVA